MINYNTESGTELPCHLSQDGCQVMPYVRELAKQITANCKMNKALMKEIGFLHRFRGF